MVDIQGLLDWEIPYLNISVLSFLVAIVITVIAWIVIVGVVLPVIGRALEKAKLPPLLSGLFTRVIRVLMMIVVLLIFLSSIGIDTGSLVLALSAIIGLAFAFGLSDSMNNFFAGTWIAMTQPFRMGEVVSVAGFTGKINAVGIMVTEMLTPDNVYISIPNKLVWGSAVTNYSRMPKRRVNTDVGIAYGSDVQKAYDVAMRIMREHPKVVDEPAPSIYMTELADSSVNLQLRPWAKNEDYWDVLHDMRRSLHDELPKAGVEIPFPQVDVHMIAPSAPARPAPPAPYTG
jgi:small conductance mechanosensitive channel